MPKNNSRIILPSAKLVPEELWSLGKLPGIIYPINQRIVFDYLYEQYKGFDIDIICYEKAEKVQRRLEKYISDKVKIKILDALSDLGHTVYFALGSVTGPIIINFADTIYPHLSVRTRFIAMRTICRKHGPISTRKAAEL